MIILEVQITEKCSCYMSGLDYSWRLSLSQSFLRGIIIWIFWIPDAINLSLQNNSWIYLLFLGYLSSPIAQVNQLNLCAPKWVCYLSTEALHAQKAQTAPFLRFAQKQIIPEGCSQMETLPCDSDTPMCFSLLDFIQQFSPEHFHSFAYDN